MYFTRSCRAIDKVSASRSGNLRLKAVDPDVFFADRDGLRPVVFGGIPLPIVSCRWCSVYFYIAGRISGPARDGDCGGVGGSPRAVYFGDSDFVCTNQVAGGTSSVGDSTSSRFPS